MVSSSQAHNFNHNHTTMSRKNTTALRYLTAAATSENTDTVSSGKCIKLHSKNNSKRPIRNRLNIYAATVWLNIGIYKLLRGPIGHFYWRAGRSLSPPAMHWQTSVIIKLQISYYDCICRKTMTDELREVDVCMFDFMMFGERTTFGISILRRSLVVFIGFWVFF